jgi:serine/threonine protein kinase
MHETAKEINLTASGAAVGTPHYMASEQIEHPQDVDQRADIYSLGVVFYELLTGELPLGRFAPPSEKSSVDPRIDDVVLRTLEKEREKRYRSAGEVKTKVEAITEKSLVSQEPTAMRRQASMAWGNLAMVIALSLFLMVVAFLVWSNTHQRSPTTSDNSLRTSTNGQPAKTLVLVRATDQLIDATNGVRTVTVWTDSMVQPGEILQAMQRLPDGQFTSASSSLHVQRSPKGTKTSSAFSWFFQASFGEQEAQSAMSQLQLNVLERPVSLSIGQPLALFSVTNKFGGVLSGYLVYKCVTPGSSPGSTTSYAQVHATIRLRPSGPLAFYSADVPAGYALQATANWLEIDDGDASTMSPSGPHGYHSS